MFLFDILFGKKNAAPAVSSPPPAAPVTPVQRQAGAPGTSIYFDPQLIDALQADHRMLLDIYKSIDAAKSAGDLSAIQTRLDQFRMLIQDHLLKENVRLYVYLERVLKDDPTSHQLMHEFRHEMDGIGRVVVGFLTKYRDIASHPELVDDFTRDFAAIGQALVARIRREESTLYPMYAPPA